MGQVILKYSKSKIIAKELGDKTRQILWDRKYLWVENAKRSISLLPFNKNVE